MGSVRTCKAICPSVSQEAILNLPQEIEGRCQIHEKGLRPLRSEVDFDRQRETWRDLLGKQGN